MAAKFKVSILAVLLIAASGAFAASASLTGSVDRSSNVDVVNDDTGIIALQDGSDGGLVYQNDTGALAVDFTNGSASGVNTAAHFEIGDTANANTTYAFNVTNLGDATHDFTFDYTQNTAHSDGNSNLQFKVYNESESPVGTADEEGNTASVAGVAPGETLYVVIVVDTHGLDSDDDLSGDLTISV